MPPSMKGRAEREEFLAGYTFGGAQRGLRRRGPDPLGVPVWYTYQAGGTLNVSTGSGTTQGPKVSWRPGGSACAPGQKRTALQGTSP